MHTSADWHATRFPRFSSLIARSRIAGVAYLTYKGLIVVGVSLAQHFPQLQRLTHSSSHP